MHTGRMIICSVYSWLIICSMFVQAQKPDPAKAAPTLVGIRDNTNRVLRAWQSNPAITPDQKFNGTLRFDVNGKVTVLHINAEDLSDIAKDIERLPYGSKVITSAASDGLRLDILPKVAFNDFSGTGELRPVAGGDEDVTTVNFSERYDLVLPNVQRDNDKYVWVQTANKQRVDLKEHSWVWRYSDTPVIVLTIESQCTPAQKVLDPYSTSCTQQYLLARNDGDIVVTVMEVKDNGLAIDGDALNGGLRYAVNGALPLDPDNGPFLVPIVRGDIWHINWFRSTIGCRAYNVLPEEHGNADLYEPSGIHNLDGIKSDYIMVGNAKVFDVALLQQMLNGTSAQLAAISGFSAASITAAYGTLQGVTRDTSFLSAQATTTPLPTIATTNSTGQTTSSQLVTGSAGPSQTATTVTLQCPDGSLPTLGSSSSVGCTVPTAPPGTAIVVPTTSAGTITTSGTSTPGATNQNTTGNGTSQQSGSTATTTGVAGTVPTAPASTAFAAPTNVGVSSADILTEQVELNAQITTLRLLLQGALSDQYVIRGSRPVATRKQTTLGFTITLDPPRQFRHAVAEVRVLIVPPPGPEGVSIVNLLPAEKTYNVAKITSHQDAFGAGVAVAPVSVGVNVGRSKDRLYLAKDTDTLALQYTPPVETLTGIDRPFPQLTHDKYKGLVTFMGANELGDCPVPDKVIGTNATVFGWQFRPVLGADYVRGGQRQVFAQLALPPNATSDTFAPKLYVQTRWRAYDPKRQVVGAVYTSSCSSAPDLSGIADTPVIVVKNVEMADLGGGQVKLTSTGQFDTPSLSVLAGATNVVPLTSDGATLQLFGNAHDLLAADQLTILGPSGSMTSFGMRAKHDGCDISSATLYGVPYPDGNSRMTLRLTMGRNYLPETNADGLPKPLVLIGSQVYGLGQTPFRSESCERHRPSVCTYKFIAPTTDARNAQTFLVKDLRWEHMTQKGTTDFFPLFSSLTTAALPPPASPTCPDQSPKPKCPPLTGPSPAKTTLVVSGFDFDKLTKNVSSCTTPSAKEPCLNTYVGSSTTTPLKLFTKTSATLDVDQDSLKNAKMIRFQLYGQSQPDKTIDEYSVEWDLPVPKPEKTPSVTATPAFLRVSDSASVTFQGDKISTVDDQTVMFDGSLHVNAKLDTDPTTPTSMTLTVYIPTAVTKTPGHKELTVNIKGSSPTKTLQLPIDVYK